MEEIIGFVTEYWLYLIVGVFVLFVITGICIANFSYDKYLKAFEEMNKVGTSFRGDAYTFAKRFSTFFFASRIKVQVMPEKDMPSYGSYTPATSTVALSSKIATTGSIATLAIVAHEFGHAHQHFFTKMLNKHSSNHRIISLLGNINLLLVIAGCILGFLYGYVYALLCLAFIAFNFLFAIIFKLQTVKIENNASEIAIKMLKNINFDENEITEIKALLKLAKRTYTADFLKAILSWTGLVRRPNFFDF